MYNTSVTLLDRSFTSDSIGVQSGAITQTEVPIMKIEDIYANEFYQANEQGFKPSLRIRISSLNYANQRELIYKGTTYTVIRTQEPVPDETILICQRKVKNV